VSRKKEENQVTDEVSDKFDVMDLAYN